MTTTPPAPPAPTGRVVPTDAGRDLVLTRTFRSPIEDVWASITEPERTARWFASWTGEPGAGSTIRYRMTHEGDEAPEGDMTIDACEPPHHLAVSAVDDEGTWRLEATLAQDLRGDEAALFASGTLMLESETTPLLPARLDVLGPRRARLTLHEGRYHQVRRMFAATGNHVEALHRPQVGGLALGDLEEGRWRALQAPDLDTLFNLESA